MIKIIIILFFCQYFFKFIMFLFFKSAIINFTELMFQNMNKLNGYILFIQHIQSSATN